MIKKFVCAILAVVLMLSLLAGCGGGAGDEVDLTGEVTGAITVSCYDAMTYKSFLEAAAQKFEDKYPGTTVEVVTAGSMPEIRTQESENFMISVVQNQDNPQARDDYISKINTELMSGKGADVIALDILPYYKYADNGQLVDLSGLMKNDRDFNLADYAVNIFDGAKYKGGQYLFPINYTFDYFTYDKSLAPDFPAKDKLSFTEAIAAVADKADVSGNKILGYTSYSGQLRGPSMFSAMLAENYEQFIDLANKKVNLADGAFVDLLLTIQDYADKGYIQPYGANAIRADGTPDMSLFRQNQQEKYYLKRTMNLGLVNLFTRNLGQRLQMRMEGSGGGNNDDDEIAGLAANDKGEALYSYSMGFGLNSNSENKRAAWEFIKFLAEEEMQTAGLAPPIAIPVNNEARTALAAMSITGEAMRMQAGLFNIGGARRQGQETGATREAMPEQRQAGESTPEQQVGKEPPPEWQQTGELMPEQPSSDELTPEQQDSLDQYLQTLGKFANQLNKLVVRDSKIDDMINQEVGAFFSGERTAEEVADILQSKVSLYINE